jgi:hypothetical protein
MNYVHASNISGGIHASNDAVLRFNRKSGYSNKTKKDAFNGS